MLKYANLQRDMDMQKAERERDVARENLENEVAGTMDRRDPKAPNGCLWGMCNMPRGVHGHQCLGEGREGLACTDADHKVGICDEREENRRQKMKAVGLDPDAVEGPSGGWEVPKNAIGRSVEDEAAQWDYSA
ncbi:uncharacterized protein RCC_04875 [Ramularia collo-cygni]|uniref:Uncharacterized protein n=1 Tax=Ramularia collo-cygni TaxID=112498 RepID=A0A2D3VBQ5_9PEZI|nr:uncharacterized protein RCC_04875 [Ramularia collo-cygni]CZT19029.1 uncharacterized protein RCC_04875 [Ramularia collo-cygni]